MLKVRSILFNYLIKTKKKTKKKIETKNILIKEKQL